jgi:hypothetical protein
MATMVDTQEYRLAEALRAVLSYAVKDVPSWAPQDALDARHRTYTAAQCALLDYDEREPVLMEPMSVVLDHGTSALAA